MIKFPIYFVDQPLDEVDLPEDDICYLIGKSGISLKKRLGIIDSIVPVDSISFLEDVYPDATMHINPISKEVAAQTMTFFKAIYNIHRSEAIVLIFHHPETGDIKVLPPHQKVRGAACDYTRGSVRIEGYDLIGTIHSHANFSAFHSGTDAGDEKTFDGLHITFGHVDDSEISISCSIVVNGFRVIVDPNEYIDGLVSVQKMKTAGGKYYKYDLEKKEMVDYIKDPEYTTRYKFDVPQRDLRYNKTWLKKVELKKYESTYGTWGMESGASGIYDKTIPSPYNVGPSTGVKPLTFPDHESEADFNPCASCVFKDYKIDWAIDQYTEEDDSELEDNNHIMQDSEMYFEGEGIINPDELHEDPDALVHEQHTNPEFLTGDDLNDGPNDGDKIPLPDELPPNLKGKPASWIKNWLRRVPS